MTFVQKNEELLKIINTVLLTIITLATGIIVGWAVRMDRKMQTVMTNQASIQQQIIGHNLEANVWKSRIEALEESLDNHKESNNKDMEAFRTWVEREFVHK